MVVVVAVFVDSEQILNSVLAVTPDKNNLHANAARRVRA